MEPNEPLSISIAVPLTPVDGDNSEALERELSEHYFRISPAEYFERRLWEIIRTVDTASRDVSDWHTDDPATLFNQYATLVGKNIDLDNPPGYTLDSTTMASIESYTLMQHVIETVLRLYVAAQSRRIGASPMQELLRLRTSDQLRQPIKELLRDDVAQTVKATIFPPELHSADGAEDTSQMDDHILFLVEWLKHFAYFYSDEHFGGAQGNNQLKHGAAVAPRADIEYSYYTEIPQKESLTDNEGDAGTPLINGPSVSYMELMKRKGYEPGIRLRTDNSDPATNLAIAGVGISIIRSLWIIAGAVAKPLDPINYLFDFSPLPDEVFGKSKRPPRSVVRILRAPTRKIEAKKSPQTKRNATLRRNGAT